MLRRLFLAAIVLCALTQQTQRVWSQQPTAQQTAAQQTASQQTPPSATPKTDPASAQSKDTVGSDTLFQRGLTTEQFAQLSARLSEPNGYFDTDNLISNESSYLHVMGKLRQLKLSGGAFIGVGPDQSFSYIAQIRPRIVFMVDIRRDNLLQHVWFKSLFALSRNRMEYLCLMFGKPVPADLKTWDTRSIQDIVAYLDKNSSKRELFTKTVADVQARVKSFGLKLEPSELETITRIHTAFFEAGPNLKFTSKGRAPRYYYPDYRDLLLEKDLTGRQCNYLVTEDDFRYLQTLEERNLVVPVVGNLAGGQALRQIAQFLREKGERVSAFYTSNVEFYLMRGYQDTEFDQFARNLSTLPRNANSVIIRSYFNGTWGYEHPQTVSGYYSTQLLQTMDSFVKEYDAGGYRSYTDLIGKHLLDLR